MKLMKLLVFLLATLFTLTSLAEGLTPPNEQMPKPGFSFGFTGIGAIVSASNMLYATQYSDGSDALTSLATVTPFLGVKLFTPLQVQAQGRVVHQNVIPEYHFAFRAHAGYVYPDRYQDWQLAWIHYNARDGGRYFRQLNFTNRATVVNVGVPVIAVGTFNGVDKALGRVKFKFNSFDASYGHYEHWDNLLIRFFVGLRYAEIVQEKNTVESTVGRYRQVTPGFNPVLGNVLGTLATCDKSDFNGTGPRVGFRGWYELPYGFGITAHTAVSMLIGSITTDSLYSSQNRVLAPGIAPAFSSTQVLIRTKDRLRARVIPSFDASAGIAYMHVFSWATVKLGFGYRYDFYFHALRTLQLHPTATAGTNNAYISNPIKSNFSLGGPYGDITFEM